MVGGFGKLFCLCPVGGVLGHTTMAGVSSVGDGSCMVNVGMTSSIFLASFLSFPFEESDDGIDMDVSDEFVEVTCDVCKNEICNCYSSPKITKMFVTLTSLDV